MSKKNFKQMINQRRGYGEAKKREKEIESRRNSVNRFWIPPEKGAKIIILDDNPPVLDEHQIKIRGDWRNWFTCLRQFGIPCPLCDILQDNPSTVGFYTIIDTSEFTDNSGKRRVNEKKLLPAKVESLKMLRHQSKKRDGLEYTVWDVYRSSSDAVNIGNSWDYEGQLTKEKILELEKVDDIEPFDYGEILKPKEPEVLKEILNVNSRAYDEGELDEEFEDDDYSIDI